MPKTIPFEDQYWNHRLAEYDKGIFADYEGEDYEDEDDIDIDAVIREQEFADDARAWENMYNE